MAVPDTLPDLTRLTAAELEQLLEIHAIALTAAEALAVQQILDRPPSLAELVLWSIQGSEHCSYRSSRAHLKKLVTQGPNVILGAKEDAGIVAVATDHAGRRYGVAVSHESHNHPSQLVPYEGAATGVGGNIRDVCCMGAEVIAIADGLRFGDIGHPNTLWLYEGVVSGIAGYGNPVGVPTIAGDLYFDRGYNDNCLVTVVTLGIVREDEIIHSFVPAGGENHVFVLVGRPTDNSGFGGASFASRDLSPGVSDTQRGAVQEPNAFLGHHLLKASTALFKKIHAEGLGSRVGFKDLGAGGIACASVELAHAGGYGAEIDLDQVPIGMQDLPAHVVLCAETQERYLWAVPEELVDRILDHYNTVFALPAVSVGARAAVIGRVRTDGLYVVKSRGQTIVSAPASAVTAGIHQERPLCPPVSRPVMPLTLPPADWNAHLLALLSHENIASRRPVFECYDKQVQGRTVIEAGCADAGVLQPFNDDNWPAEIRQTGIALSLDHSPRYSRLDPYWGAVNAVLESARNVTAVGAKPVSITDCLCFGNPENPQHMWAFSESVRGMAEACAALSLPVIAGNVSFYNETAGEAIPPSPMISCLGVLTDVCFVQTAGFVKQNSLLVLSAPRRDEMHLPLPDLGNAAAEIRAVQAAMQAKLVRSAHDISEGGLAVAICEMGFERSIGAEITVSGDLPDERKLFSETGGFILEVAREHLPALNRIFAAEHLVPEVIGRTLAEPVFRFQERIVLGISAAKHAFENGLRDRLRRTVICEGEVA